MQGLTETLPRRRSHPEQEIRYWMTAPAITVNLAAPLSEAFGLMHEHEIRRLPVVVDTGELRGMITMGDIRGAEVLGSAGIDLLEIAAALKEIRVYQVMTDRQLVTCRPETSLREAALLMVENKIGGIPVVDELQQVVGIITESDLFDALVYYLDRESVTR